ncbi:MAG: hypothetical protein COB08_009755 [Rhodobacteraceae bacterium]|nr:hypothetical protein [Paracoccaceae bacterium]
MKAERQGVAWAMQYESLFDDHLKYSCLPPSCQRAIRAVRQALRNESVFPKAVALPKALDMVALSFKSLPPEITPHAMLEIRSIAELWPFQRPYAPLSPRAYLEKIDHEVSKLDAAPKLAMLYLFHGDGRLRQAALHRITPSMLSPFLFAALTTRLNDWARPVRQEAATSMARICTAETLARIAPAIPYLCLQSKTWQRWKEQSAAYEKIEATPEVAEYMAQHLRTSLHGPLPRQCRAMLRHDIFDAHLLELAHTAATPNVRAIALGALLNQRASWMIGRQKRWVDKFYGISRMDPIWAHRTITIPVSIPDLVYFGAQNRAAAVRRIVAYWLLKTDKPYPEAVALLSKDKYPSIRKAMEYYKRKRAENA